MNKVYVVYQSSGSYDDYHSWVDSIWNCPIKAEQRKQEIKKEKDLVFLEYFNKYGTEYEKDLELQEELMKNGEWKKYEKLYTRTSDFLYSDADYILEKHEPTISEIELNKII